MKTFNLDGIIGLDVTSVDINRFLESAAGEDIEVKISSPGGSVAQMLTIFNAVKNYAGRTTAVLSGYVMSAASYVAMAFDQVEVEQNAVFMAHNVLGAVLGFPKEIIKYGQDGLQISRMMHATYTARSFMSAAEMDAAMDEERQFVGGEIVTAGFGDLLRDGGEEMERTALATAARSALSECRKRLQADVTAAIDDMRQAVAMVPKKTGVSKMGQKPQATGEPKKMNLQELKAQHGELVAELHREFMAAITLDMLNSGNSELVASIMDKGAAAELARVNDVRQNLVPGYEELVERMAADGKSTGTDVALAIVQAEKQARQNAAQHQPANPLVPPAAPQDGAKQLKRAEFNNLSHTARAEAIRSGVKVVD